jgi:signal peptidase II
MNRSLKILSLNIFALFLIVADQLSKHFILKNPDIFRDFSIFNIINVKLNKNYDLAMSIKVPYLLLYLSIALAVVFVVVLLIKSYQQKKPLNTFILTVILAGALSNIIDRLTLGYVIDFINIPLFTTFNLADIYITLGVSYLIIYTLAFETQDDL